MQAERERESVCVCGVCVCVCVFVRLGVVAWVRLIRIVIDGSYSLQQFSLEQSLNVRAKKVHAQMHT